MKNSDNRLLFPSADDGRKTPNWLLAGVAVLCLGAAVSGLGSAQPGTADELPRDFHRISAYFLLIDGRQVPEAEIYQSSRPAAVLVISSVLPSPVLLMAGSVATVDRDKVEKAEGLVSLLRDAMPIKHGGYEYVDKSVKFNVADHEGVLRLKPPLLGLRRAEEVTSHNPEYVYGAKSYVADQQATVSLRRRQQPATVRVYYGSWCPHCGMLVPIALKVEQALGASKIRFEYFGVPEGFLTDPEMKKLDIRAIPTGVVLIEGREVGRIRGDDAWKSFETTLRGILEGQDAASGS